MEGYTYADQKLHFLSQVIAKANRSYVPSKPDDSHTNLYFDTLDSRIVGRWINNGKDQLLLTLNLDTYEFEWLNSHKEPVLTIGTIGKMITDVEDEIDSRLGDLNLKPQGFKEPLHFKIPDYPFANEPISEIDTLHLKAWKNFRQLANRLCFLVMGDIQIVGDVRIWPHHFDTGMYVEIGQKLGLGFGLAMEDAMVGQPYFYMAGYPIHGQIKYENLPEMEAGTWMISDKWKGSVLPLTELTNGSFSENRQVITDYLSKSINWYVSHW
jgi:hypothetical protein